MQIYQLYGVKLLSLYAFDAYNPLIENEHSHPNPGLCNPRLQVSFANAESR